MVVAPGPLVPRLLDAGLIGERHGTRAMIAVWRAAERLAASPVWTDRAALIDVPVFGEIGLVAARRGPGCKILPLPLGRVSAPSSRPHALGVIEIARTANGTV